MEREKRHEDLEAHDPNIRGVDIAVGAGVMATIIGVFLLLGQCVGCTFKMEHDVDVRISAECAACFPACDWSGEVSCETPDGEECAACVPACAFGRELVCEEDGPHCLQEAGPDGFHTPIACVAEAR